MCPFFTPDSVGVQPKGVGRSRSTSFDCRWTLREDTTPTLVSSQMSTSKCFSHEDGIPELVIDQLEV